MLSDEKTWTETHLMWRLYSKTFSLSAKYVSLFNVLPISGLICKFWHIYSLIFPVMLCFFMLLHDLTNSSSNVAVRQKWSSYFSSIKASRVVSHVRMITWGGHVARHASMRWSEPVLLPLLCYISCYPMLESIGSRKSTVELVFPTLDLNVSQCICIRLGNMDACSKRMFLWQVSELKKHLFSRL